MFRTFGLGVRMAITKLNQIDIDDTRSFIQSVSGKPTNWSPAVNSVQQLQDVNLSLIYDSAKNALTVYYFIDNTLDGTTTLFSQAFKATGAPSTKTKLITNIYATADSDAKTKAFYDLEKSLAIDFDGDGLVGSSIVVQASGSKTLALNDLSPLSENPNYYLTMGLAANGKAGTTLNINPTAAGFEQPIIIGTLSTDSASTESIYADALMSAYQIGFPSVTAGFGIGKQGTVNISSAELYFTGGLISSYMIQALNLDSEYANLVIGGIGAGFGPRSKGTMNITNSELYFHRTIDPTDPASTDYDVMNAWLSAGVAGANGTTNITNSLVELKGTDNNIGIADDAGSVGVITLNSARVYLDAQYSVNDDPNSEDSLAYSDVIIGSGKAAKATLSLVNNSVLQIDGASANCEVGREGSTGVLNINASRVQQIAQRSYDPLTRDVSPLSIDEYSYSWSGSYLTVGYGDSDGSATTNDASVGTAIMTNGSAYLIKGPHAGIEVGGSSTKSKGTLTLDSSSIEVIGSGAIQIPETVGDSSEDYLAAGYNNGGSLNTDYFTFVNIGGSSWKDFGGEGTITLNNHSTMKVFGFDITSGDTVLEGNLAYLTIGGWGTKAGLNINGDSLVSVAGRVSLGLSNDLSATAFDKNHGLYNLNNYSMVNVQNGEVESYSYYSQIADQGSASPISKYAMFTVLGTQGTITANQFGFYKNSQIIGSGTLNVEDVFSSATVSLHDDLDTVVSYLTSDESASGQMHIEESQFFIGDSFKFDNLSKTVGYGTLTIKDLTDNDISAYVSVEDSTLVFDLGKTQSDKLVVQGFDTCNFANDTFVINGKTAVRGQSYVLVDYQMESGSYLDLDLNSFVVNLIGVNGALSYDESASDLIFTVA